MPMLELNKRVQAWGLRATEPMVVIGVAISGNFFAVAPAASKTRVSYFLPR